MNDKIFKALEIVNNDIKNAEEALKGVWFDCHDDVTGLSWARNDHNRYRILLNGKVLAESKMQDRIDTYKVLPGFVDLVLGEAEAKIDDIFDEDDQLCRF